MVLLKFAALPALARGMLFRKLGVSNCELYTSMGQYSGKATTEETAATSVREEA